MIECSECKRPVSSLATACPGCGCPVAESARGQHARAATPIKNVSPGGDEGDGEDARDGGAWPGYEPKKEEPKKPQPTKQEEGDWPGYSEAAKRTPVSFLPPVPSGSFIGVGLILILVVVLSKCHVVYLEGRLHFCTKSGFGVSDTFVYKDSNPSYETIRTLEKCLDR